jgi:hypothetical protein
MKLFLPFLIAGIVLVALLYAKFLWPSMFENVQGIVRSPNIPLSRGMMLTLGDTSVASTSGMGSGPSSEEESDVAHTNAAFSRSSQPNESGQSVSAGREAAEHMGSPRTRSPRNGGVRP